VQALPLPTSAIILYTSILYTSILYTSILYTSILYTSILYTSILYTSILYTGLIKKSTIESLICDLSEIKSGISLLRLIKNIKVLPSGQNARFAWTT